MLDWTLFNLPDPEFMANIGEPPDPIIPSANQDSRSFFDWYCSHDYRDAENYSEDDAHHYDDIHGIEPLQRGSRPANNADNGIWATVNDRVWFENNGQAANNPNRPKVTDANWPKEAVNDGNWPKNAVKNVNWQENQHANDGNWANNNAKAASNGRYRPGSNSEKAVNHGNWPNRAVNDGNMPKCALKVGNWPKNPLSDEVWQENNAEMHSNDANWPENVTEEDVMETDSDASPPEDGLPENHALPAAYMMWRDLAIYMNERASQWKDAEFQFRKQRAAILYEIQIQNMQKALLETALEEIHRQEELLEMDRLIRRHARHGLH